MNDRVGLGIEVDLFAELLGKCCFVISNSNLCFIGSIYHVVYQGICRFTWRFIVGKTLKGLLLCCTCERSSYPVSRWRTLAADEILGSLRNHDDDGNKNIHKFAYLIVKNKSFTRFARAVFIFDISQTFSFFLRREMTCFAVVWTT